MQTLFRCIQLLLGLARARTPERRSCAGNMCWLGSGLFPASPCRAFREFRTSLPQNVHHYDKLCIGCSSVVWPKGIRSDSRGNLLRYRWRDQSLVVVKHIRAQVGWSILAIGLGQPFGVVCSVEWVAHYLAKSSTLLLFMMKLLKKTSLARCDLKNSGDKLADALVTFTTFIKLGHWVDFRTRIIDEFRLSTFETDL